MPLSDGGTPVCHPGAVASPGNQDLIADDLWIDLKSVLREGQVVYTLGQQRKANRIHDVARHAIFISP